MSPPSGISMPATRVEKSWMGSPSGPANSSGATTAGTATMSSGPTAPVVVHDTTTSSPVTYDSPPLGVSNSTVGGMVVVVVVVVGGGVVMLNGASDRSSAWELPTRATRSLPIMEVGTVQTTEPAATSTSSATRVVAPPRSSTTQYRSPVSQPAESVTRSSH